MNKHEQEKFSQLWLPLLAIIFSVVSLIISFRSCSLSERNYELSLIPILKVRFVIDRSADKHTISLSNDGANPIYEIRIRRVIRLVSTDVEPMGSLRSSRDWDSVAILQPGDSRAFAISKADIELSFQGENWVHPDGKQPLGSALTFLVSYRREPDKKKFHTAKTLFFTRDSDTKRPIAWDPDEHGEESWRKAANKLQSLDEDFDF